MAAPSGGRRCWYCSRHARYFGQGRTRLCSVCELWVWRNWYCRIRDALCCMARHRVNLDSNYKSRMLFLQGWEVFRDPADSRVWYWSEGYNIASFAHPLTPFCKPGVWSLILAMLVDSDSHILMLGNFRVWRDVLLGQQRNMWFRDISDSEDSDEDSPEPAGAFHPYYGCRRWSSIWNRQMFPLWMASNQHMRSFRYTPRWSLCLNSPTVLNLIIAYLGALPWPPWTAECKPVGSFEDDAEASSDSRDPSWLT